MLWKILAGIYGPTVMGIDMVHDLVKKPATNPRKLDDLFNCYPRMLR